MFPDDPPKNADAFALTPEESAELGDLFSRGPNLPDEIGLAETMVKVTGNLAEIGAQRAIAYALIGIAKILARIEAEM